MVVGREVNNQMFSIAWAMVLTENTETWSWFINQLCAGLNIGESLGWSVISNIQKV